MNCTDIIKQHIKENGFDGLYNCEGECGCIMSDIAPCDRIETDTCHPGYLQADKEEYDFMLGNCKPTKCPACGLMRDINKEGAFKTCHHCGDEIPF
jgi:hypothetical protein